MNKLKFLIEKYTFKIRFWLYKRKARGLKNYPWCSMAHLEMMNIVYDSIKPTTTSTKESSDA